MEKKKKFKLIQALQERSKKSKSKSMLEVIKTRGAKGLAKRKIKKSE